jgi:thioester reductase-like protein
VVPTTNAIIQWAANRTRSNGTNDNKNITLMSQSVSSESKGASCNRDNEPPKNIGNVVDEKEDLIRRKDHAWALDDPAFAASLIASMSMHIRNQRLPNYNIPHAIVLELIPFTIANGLLTRSVKLCRPAIMLRYRSKLQALYHDGVHNDNKESKDTTPSSSSPLSSVVTGNQSISEKMLAAVHHQFPATRASSSKISSPLSMSFEELGGDSLALTQFIAYLSRSYGIVITASNIVKARSLNEVIDEYDRHNNSLFSISTPTIANTFEPVTPPDLHAEVNYVWSSYLKEIKDRIATTTSTIPLTSSSSSLCPSEFHVFVTGATGFLGAYIVHSLLTMSSQLSDHLLPKQDPSSLSSSPPLTVVHCLVRAANDDDAMKRLIKALTPVWKRIGDGDAKVTTELKDVVSSNRLRCITGDLEAINYGLSLHQFETLVAQMNLIIHNGAVVNALLPYQSLKPANVDGTLTAITMSLIGQQRRQSLLASSPTSAPTPTPTPTPIAFVSTVGVLPLGVVSESYDLTTASIADLYRLSGYSQSKHVAERIISLAHTHLGVPITINRPAMIAGSTLTGHCNDHDWVSRFICGCIQLGVWMDHDGDQGDVDWIPVDYVAKAIVVLALHSSVSSLSSSANSVYHMCHPSRLTRSHEIYNGLIAAGYTSLKLVSSQDFVTMLTPPSIASSSSSLSLSSNNRASSLRHMFVNGFPSMVYKYECESTIALLRRIDNQLKFNSSAKKDNSNSNSDIPFFTDITTSVIQCYVNYLGATVVGKAM